jgi:hypothetical protein
MSVYIAIAFVWFIVLGYCSLNLRKNNYYGLSTISINNQLANIIINGAYVNGEDSELIDVINKSLLEKKSVYQIVFTLNTMTIPQDYVQNYPSFLSPSVHQAISENGKGYAMERLAKFIKKSNLSLIYFKNMLYRTKSFLLAYKKIAIVSLFSFIIIFIKYFKTNKIPMMITFMVFAIWLNIASIILFSINEWERLILPSMPLIILVYVYFIDLVLRYVGYESILNQFKKFKDHIITTIN